MTISTSELERLHGYLDDELPAPERSAFAARVVVDTSLSATVAAEERFRTALRMRVMRTHAPTTLQSKVRLALTPVPTLPWWQRWWTWLVMPYPVRPLTGLAFGLLLIVVGGTVWWSGRSTAASARAVDTLFQRHELYFENGPALDVIGDAAQIHTWFAQKVPDPVDAPLLNDEWQLIGARLDEFQQQQTAHILYMRGNGQRTSLSIFPRQALPSPVGRKMRFAEQEFWLLDNDVHLAILWYTEQKGYALIGDIEVPTPELLQLAVEARTQLP